MQLHSPPFCKTRRATQRHQGISPPAPKSRPSFTKTGRRPTIGAGRVVRNAEPASSGHLPALARSDDSPTFPQVAEGRFQQSVNFYEGPPPTAMQLHSGRRPTIGAGRVVRNEESANGAHFVRIDKTPWISIPPPGEMPERCRFVQNQPAPEAPQTGGVHKQTES